MLNKLKEIINGRNICILAHGKSINELADKIKDFKDLDICWATLNSFPMMEKYILNTIDKRISVLFDCSTVPESRIVEYEKFRTYRISNYLMREDNNIWITSYGLIRDLKPLGYEIFTNAWIHKTLQVDKLFPPYKIPYYMSVPNSVTLLIAACIAGGAKKIITFGLDGYNGDIEKGLDSCFHPEIVREERLLALGSKNDEGINRDTILFEKNFGRLYEEYKKLFNSNTEIFNCSPSSIYTCIKKITYDEALKELI